MVEADLGLYDYCALVPVLTGAGGVMTDWEVRATCPNLMRDRAWCITTGPTPRASVAPIAAQLPWRCREFMLAPWRCREFMLASVVCHQTTAAVLKRYPRTALSAPGTVSGYRLSCKPVLRAVPERAPALAALCLDLR